MCLAFVNNCCLCSMVKYGYCCLVTLKMCSLLLFGFYVCLCMFACPTVPSVVHPISNCFTVTILVCKLTLHGQLSKQPFKGGICQLPNQCNLACIAENCTLAIKIIIGLAGQTQQHNK